MKEKKYQVFLLLILTVFVFSCSQQQEKNLTLFHGGTIMTVDENFSEVEALVVEDQKIIATGSFEQMEDQFGNGTRLIDLNGKTMLPGFVDPHAHVVSFAPIVFLTEDIGLVNFKTTDEALEHLKRLPRKLKQGNGLWPATGIPLYRKGFRP